MQKNDQKSNKDLSYYINLSITVVVEFAFFVLICWLAFVFLLMFKRYVWDINFYIVLVLEFLIVLGCFYKFIRFLKKQV